MAVTDLTRRLVSQCTIKGGLPIPLAFCSRGRILDGLLAVVPVGTVVFQVEAARVLVSHGLAGGFDGGVYPMLRHSKRVSAAYIVKDGNRLRGNGCKNQTGL